jgi:hypothetical protein
MVDSVGLVVIGNHESQNLGGVLRCHEFDRFPQVFSLLERLTRCELHTMSNVE